MLWNKTKFLSKEFTVWYFQDYQNRNIGRKSTWLHRLSGGVICSFSIGISLFHSMLIFCSMFTFFQCNPIQCHKFKHNLDDEYAQIYSFRPNLLNWPSNLYLQVISLYFPTSYIFIFFIKFIKFS